MFHLLQLTTHNQDIKLPFPVKKVKGVRTNTLYLSQMSKS